MNPRDRFAAFASRRDEQLDLAEGALLIAAEAYPSLDVELYLSRLDALADRAEGFLPPLDLPGPEGRSEVDPAGREALETVRALNRFLYRDQGFAGDAESYYDERNSFLCDVLDRRRGIPITLAVVYLEVAHRLRVPIEGVNFPTHFLLRHAAEPNILIDPFAGRVVSRAECEGMLRRSLGDEDAQLGDQHFPRADARRMLVRMLGNLKHIYASAEDFEKALSCSERALLLDPEDWIERRDRGLLYARLECWQSALEDLEGFVRAAGKQALRGPVAQALEEVRRHARQIH